MEKTFTKALVVFICLFAAWGQAFAHEGMLKGRVYDAQTRVALPGANVRIVSASLGAVTDETGAFMLNHLALGTCDVRISYLGYLDTLISVNIQEHVVANLDIPLQVGEIQLAGVDIRAGEDAPFSAVSGLDLHLRPINSAQDMLRSVPGLFIAQHAGGGKAEQIFLRGFDIDHGTDIRITADGLPVNMVSHAHGQGYADLHFIIPETVRELEFGKGPYYARQGNLATAGYVGFRSYNQLDHSLVKIESGAYNTWRGLAMIDVLGKGMREKGQSLYVAAERLHSEGYFENPQDFVRTNLMLKYHGRLSESQFLTASLSGFGSAWNASGQIPQRAVANGSISPFGAIDPTEGGKTGRKQANLELLSLLPSGAQVRNQIYAIHYDFDLFSNFTFFLDDSLNGDQIRQNERRNILGYNLSMNQDDEILGLQVRHSAGVSFRSDFVKDVHLSHTLNRSTLLESYARGDVREMNASAWAEEHIHLGARTRLDAGLRYDQFRFEYDNALDPAAPNRTVWQGRVSPKLNLNYQAHENILFFLQSGIGFHSNDTRVVTAQNGLETLPRATGAETGMTLKLKDKLLFNTALWWLDMQQEFVYVGDAGVVEPSGRSQRMGIDLSLRYQLLSWLFLDADYNYARPRGADERGDLNQHIPLAPLHSSIGGLTFMHKGFSGSLRYRYLGDRPANEDYSQTAEGYFLLNASAQYEAKRFLVGGSIDNLLNTFWKEAQFETESRLRNEAAPVTEIHFTPGSPRFWKLWVGFKF